MTTSYIQINILTNQRTKTPGAFI